MLVDHITKRDPAAAPSVSTETENADLKQKLEQAAIMIASVCDERDELNAKKAKLETEISMLTPRLQHTNQLLADARVENQKLLLKNKLFSTELAERKDHLDKQVAKLINEVMRSK